MGITYVEGTVTGPTGKQTAVRLLVDSGATYTLLSPVHWKAIELSPIRSILFTFADGTSVERKVSECFISLPQGQEHTQVILGEDGDESLLGLVTLEILGLIFNPFNKTLQRLYKKRCHTRMLQSGVSYFDFKLFSDPRQRHWGDRVLYCTASDATSSNGSRPTISYH